MEEDPDEGLLGVPQKRQRLDGSRHKNVRSHGRAPIDFEKMAVAGNDGEGKNTKHGALKKTLIKFKKARKPTV